MAKTPREHRLETREARSKLKAHPEPYWRKLIPGTFLGYRKTATTGAWISRQRDGKRYVEQRLATADDHLDADGEVVLGYAMAVRKLTDTQTVLRGRGAPRHLRDGKTLNDVLDYYLKERLSGRGSESISRQFIDRHIRSGIGTKLVTALDTETLRAWHRGLAAKSPSRRRAAEGSTRKSESDPAKAYDAKDPANRRARQASANRILTILKAALNFAWEEDKLPEAMPTYWKKVSAFKLTEDAPPRMLDTDEITRLLNAASPDVRRLLTGALLTGARYGELRAMKVGAFSPEGTTVVIYQTKTGKTLHQPLTAEGIAFFDSLTAGRAKSDQMFMKADGTAWGKDHVNRRVRAAANGARLQDVTFKTTRATYGKLLLLATRDIEMVAKALGHSDSRVTRKHYAQYLPNELAAAVAKVPALGIGADASIARIGRKRKAATPK